MLNKTKIKIPKKYEKYIDEIYFYTEPNTYAAKLKNGYCNLNGGGLHYMGIDTQKQFLEELKNIKPCTCNECTERSREDETNI